MLKKLARRNLVLMVAVVLAGQLLAGLLVMGLVIRPQVERVATVTSETIGALSIAMASVSPEHRRRMIDEINRGGQLSIRTLTDQPDSGRRFPSFIERQFTRALAEHLTTQSHLMWRTDIGGRMWVRLTLGEEDYWVSVTPPGMRGAGFSLVISFGAAFIAAAAGGLILQRRLDAPLRRLAKSVDAYTPEGKNPPLDTSGPEEVAAVAGAFNRMTARLDEQTLERALMLGGVSHDLRTPLTRLRLCLEMMQGHDADLEATASRQVDRIEAMLNQFLDFARGFENEPLVACDIADLLVSVAADCGADDIPEVDVEPGLRAFVRPEALSRAIGNLVANALRHGAPPVHIKASQKGDLLRIAVIDAGDGIDAERKDQLLRPFARGNSARSGDGAGLGLAIADRVAAAHDGRILFEKSPGRFAIMIEIKGIIDPST